MICVTPVYLPGDFYLFSVSYATPCAPHEYVLLTQAEQDSAASPLNISLADGGAIGAAVMLVWAIAFGVRMVIRVIRDSESSAVDAD